MLDIQKIWKIGLTCTIQTKEQSLPKDLNGKLYIKKKFSNKTEAMSYEYKLKHDRKKRDIIYNKSLWV